MYKIKSVSNEHIKEITDIFFEELNISTLSLFGQEFIENMFEILVKENSGFVSISEQSSKVVGFVIMTKKDISLFRCLTFKSFFFLIKKILLNFRYFKAFTISFFKLYLQRGSLKNHDMSAVELSHIAVKKDFKSQKIGTNLIKSFEDQAKKDGYKKIFTSSHNEKLVEHYKKIKNAQVLSIIDLGTYKSYNVIWNIK